MGISVFGRDRGRKKFLSEHSHAQRKKANSPRPAVNGWKTKRLHAEKKKKLKVVLRGQEARKNARHLDRRRGGKQWVEKRIMPPSWGGCKEGQGN